MGTWGMAPWDNDTAADFFGELWDGFPKLTTRVHQALRSDFGEEVVAAVWLCAQICRVYVWPIESYRETLDLAIVGVQRVLDGEDWSDTLERWEDDEPEARAQLEALRDELLARKAGRASD